MFDRHVSKNLSAYRHGELPASDARHVAEHVLHCQRCRRELEEIKFVIQQAEKLKHVPAPASLWNEIESALAASQRDQREKRGIAAFALIFKQHRLAALNATLVFVVGISALWFYMSFVRSAPAWDVARIAGQPRVNAGEIKDRGQLAVGEWLETDASSRASLHVANIGHVEIDPNTRVSLLKTRFNEHRLALERGRLSARIYAPPRLFFVNTPSAVAADLGCAYTLEVDAAGASLLHVTSGWVALQLNDRESIVPAGAACATRPGIGPGTPYFEDATEKFRGALSMIDFEKEDQTKRDGALDILLHEARSRDGLTLWHLLSRVDEGERARVYEKLAELVPPPAGVTRDGIMRLDEKMLKEWKEELRLNWFKDDPAWRRAWRWIWN